jgi:hypothetical protein
MKMINVGSFMAISKGSEGIRKWHDKLLETLEKY